MHANRLLGTLLLTSLAASISLAQSPTSTPPAVVAAPSTSDATTKELAALVEKSNLPAGMRMVCLGDSITVVTARQPVKYPEMIGLALKKKYGDKVEVFNAGKGGDNVQSALKRLATDVIPRKPTLVFINLGVNDSKLVAPEHTRNSIPFDQFTATYRDLLKAIKEQTGAESVIVGAAACVDEWTRAIAMGGEKKKTYFGNPAQLKKYNAAAQEIGKELKCDYIDLFDYFMAQPDLKALFPQDGVHANQQGQELIALQLMRYLAKKYPAP